MKPDQALTMLDNAVAQMTLNRQDHIALVQAIETLKAILPKDETVDA